MSGPLFRRTLVAGKFLPPHEGHHALIERAIAESHTVDIVVCDRPRQVPDAHTRARWPRDIHPHASVWVVPDICDWHGQVPCEPRCSPAWASHLESSGLGPWDAVAGGDSYLETFAGALDAVPVRVDVAASASPISGTMVRDDLVANWQRLRPPVRAGLTRRVVIVGAESTGTTALTHDLADALHVPWVPEYGRDYSLEQARRAGSIEDVDWAPADFDHIGHRQEELEVAVISDWVADPTRSRPGKYGPVVICDTNVLATAVWHRRYCGTDAPELVARARGRPPALYMLTSPEGVDFEQDGLRDGEHLRDEMTGWFETALAAQTAPWIEVRGSPDARLRSTLEHLEPLLTEPILWNPP